MKVYTIVKHAEDSELYPIKVYYSTHFDKDLALVTLSHYQKINPDWTFEIIESEQEIQAHDETDQKIGLAIATCLNLSENHKGQFKTFWGGKTAIGLARTIRRIMEETK
jgi:hypothetical protein